MRPVIHIGYPKCASTTLQKVFQSNPDIYYLGRGVTGNMIDYIDDDVTQLCEIELKTRRLTSYDPDYARDVVLKHIAISKMQSKQLVLSSEYFSIDDIDNIDLCEKIRRLRSIFGSASILMIIRNQFDWLKSYYKELVRQGYGYTYQDFIYWLVSKQDRNLFSCLNYKKIHDFYQKEFGSNAVKVVPFELLKLEPIKFKHEVQQVFEVDVSQQSFEVMHNAAMTDHQIIVMRMLNNRAPHTLQSSGYEGYHDFFATGYFTKTLGINSPVRSNVDEAIRSSLINIAERIGKGEVKIDFKVPTELESKLSDFFHQSNLLLENELDIPLRRLGYP